MANVQLTFLQTFKGKTINNVTHWQTPDSDTQTIQNLVDSIRSSYSVSLLTSLSSDWTFTGCLARVYDGGAPFSSVFSFTNGDLVGSSLTDALPASVSLLMATSYTGPRPNRGRIYFGGLSESSWDDGDWDPTTKSDFLNMVQQWVNGLGTGVGSAHLRIARPDSLTNTWLLDNPVETLIIRPFEGTQSRRRIK